MKKALSIFLSMILFLNFAQAASPQEEAAQQLLQKLNEAGKHPLTRDEIKKGLAEMQGLLVTLENDLSKAEKKADDRLAVKVTKYSAMSLAGFAIVGSFFNARSNAYVIEKGLNAAVLNTAYFLSFWIIVGGTSYIYLTNSELHSLRKTVSQLKVKAKHLQQKLM